MQAEFIWNGIYPKIKHSALCNKYKNGGLKNVNILFISNKTLSVPSLTAQNPILISQMIIC